MIYDEDEDTGPCFLIKSSPYIHIDAIAEIDSRQLVFCIHYQRFRKGLTPYSSDIKLITFSIPKTKILVVLDYK